MGEKTAITNVRVFDGKQLSEPRTVVVDGALIGTGAEGARVVDAAGAVLLPGLIDAHIHLADRSTLERLVTYGVTTALDMATWPHSLLESLRGVPGLTDIRSAGLPAIGPAGPHARMLGLPADAVVSEPGQAKDFVAARVAEGSDYLKMVLEAPGAGGPELETALALTVEAHSHGKRIVAHAASRGAFAMALDAGADFVTHIPLNGQLDAADVARMARQGAVAIPTLTMMKSLAAGNDDNVAAALRSVTALHEAGVPILASTDAHSIPHLPAQVKHGESLHEELALLVEAGLSPAEALRGATELPAKWFELSDRGAIEPGLRADLVLIDGDPLADITATRHIVRVWCGGVEH